MDIYCSSVITFPTVKFLIVGNIIIDITGLILIIARATVVDSHTLSHKEYCVVHYWKQKIH